jgi:hypothetical protein
MTDDNVPQQAQVRMEIADDKKAGVYANVAAVWHGPYEFTLDFGVAGMPEHDASGELFVPTPVVARVKVPTSVIFEIARAIADNVDRYEKTYGPIPQQNINPPE